MSRSQCAYCTSSGSLSPRSAMMRTRSAGCIRACPSAPRIATSGSPGRMRSTTKMIIDTPISVPRAKRARRRRYFFTRSEGGGPGSPPWNESAQPDLVPSHDIVDAEVGRGILAVHLRVPCVVDLLVTDRDERRILLEHVFDLPYHRLALVGIELFFDLRCERVEGLVRPAAVVLRTALAVPGREHVGRVHERRHDGADGEIEVARRRLVEPDRGLHDAEVRLDVEVLFQHRLDRDRPQLEALDVPDDEVEALQPLRVARVRHELARFLDGGPRVR